MSRTKAYDIISDKNLMFYCQVDVMDKKGDATEQNEVVPKLQYLYIQVISALQCSSFRILFLGRIGMDHV